MEVEIINAVVWFALSPLIVLGIFIAFLVIGHFGPVLRTIDAFFLSLLTAFLLDIIFLVLCQGIIYFLETDWPEDLCRVYTWAVMTLRFAELFTLVAFSIDRVLLIKLRGSVTNTKASNNNHNNSNNNTITSSSYSYYADAFTAAFILAAWFAASLVGAVIVAGWEDVMFFHKTADFGYLGQCTYLAHELHPHVAIFVCVMEVFCTVVCGFCLADAWCHLKYYKSRAVLSSTTNLQGELADNNQWRRASSSFLQKSHDMAVAYDNCSIGCTIALIVLLLNHLPYAALSLVGLLTDDGGDSWVSSLALRLVSLWLLVVQSLLVPHCLWLFNRRYRASLTHMRDWCACNGTFYSQESRQQHVPRLHTYIKHHQTITHIPAFAPNPSQQQSDSTTHDQLRRLSGNTQQQHRKSSFHYESFQQPVPPKKSSSESNIAVLSHVQNSSSSDLQIERSRSLEGDLDARGRNDYDLGHAGGRYDSRQQQMPPSIGARNLQMDDVIVHGRWDLTDGGDAPVGFPPKSSSQRSAQSTSSTQSPRPKRRRMMAQKRSSQPAELIAKDSDSLHNHESHSSSEHEGDLNSDSNSSDDGTVTRNKVFTKKTQRNSSRDIETSSESSIDRQSVSYDKDDVNDDVATSFSDTRSKNNPDLDLTQAHEVNLNIQPQQFEPVPFASTSDLPTPKSTSSPTTTFKPMYQCDNYVEEIMVPQQDVVIISQRDTEYIDEFSTSEFDTTSIDELSVTGSVRLKPDLYPMAFKPIEEPQFTEDATVVIVRKPVDERPRKLSEGKDAAGFEVSTQTDKDHVTVAESKNKNPFQKWSSFGKPVPIESETSSEDLKFSTDNPLYETLSRKERFEHSKQEMQRVLSMNEKDNPRDKPIRRTSSYKSRLKTRTSVERTSSVPSRTVSRTSSASNKSDAGSQCSMGEVIYIPLQTEMVDMDHIKRRSLKHSNSKQSSDVPKQTEGFERTGVSKSLSNGAVHRTIAQDQEVNKQEVIDEINGTITKRQDASAHVQLSADDMDGIIYSRGRGKFLGHFGSTAF